MKRLLASTCLASALLAGASAARAAECGHVTIASMNWQSAEVLSSIDKFVLNTGYGCDAEITIGDTVPTITSMAEKGQPDVAPEAWIDLLPDVVKHGMDEGKLVTAAKSLPDGGVQGWWIPKYFADAHPELKTIGDVLKHPELFPNPEHPEKGAVFNGPQGWGGTVVTAQLYKAFAADKAGFDLVDTGSAAGLDGSIAKAYERKQPWLGYYWSPTALLGKYPMVKLDAGVPHDAAEWKRCNTVASCPDPKPNAWPVDHVFTLVSKTFSARVNPSVMEYLKQRSWSNATVEVLMAWMTDNQASGEEGAKHFFKGNPDIWTKWVSPDAAKKIKAAL
ncbi:MAG TPA: ABC transporter substrate-binding protein [Aliidongia sp.]|nr:ABC transporter substrate-binding protein [Aliidongia sp.]